MLFYLAYKIHEHTLSNCQKGYVKLLGSDAAKNIYQITGQAKYFVNNIEIDRDGNINLNFKSLTFYWTDMVNHEINKLFDFANDFCWKVKITSIINRYMILKKTDKTMIVMRPYQIYATEAVKDRIVNANREDRGVTRTFCLCLQPKHYG